MVILIVIVSRPQPWLWLRCVLHWTAQQRKVTAIQLPSKKPWRALLLINTDLGAVVLSDDRRDLSAVQSPSCNALNCMP